MGQVPDDDVRRGGDPALLLLPLEQRRLHGRRLPAVLRPRVPASLAASQGQCARRRRLRCTVGRFRQARRPIFHGHQPRSRQQSGQVEWAHSKRRRRGDVFRRRERLRDRQTARPTALAAHASPDAVDAHDRPPSQRRPRRPVAVRRRGTFASETPANVDVRQTCLSMATLRASATTTFADADANVDANADANADADADAGRGLQSLQPSSARRAADRPRLPRLSAQLDRRWADLADAHFAVGSGGAGEHSAHLPHTIHHGRLHSHRGCGLLHLGVEGLPQVVLLLLRHTLHHRLRRHCTG
ncbi:unnamed protein product [Protopolystoma xenopodis]|uniref:Uncharacterized protein n=1 Tax=Protopolystoma xenopodis TaxID=117903 RepID=A0A3S5AIC0_9PLAT|nr:unnamed protein product [Protopolystoma xenopodis]